MLKKFKDYAIKVLEETNTNYKIKKVITEDNRHIGDRFFVKELPEQLKDLGYYLSKWKNKKGYYFICQPTIKHNQGQCFGDIPKDLLEQITEEDIKLV